MNKDCLPIFPLPMQPLEAARMDATVLSFVGDAVHTLFVRTRLASESSVKTGALHFKVAKEVSANGQSAALKNVEDTLTEEETAVYKRCRNTHQATVAKNAAVVDYKIASGFEGLIGYLYLVGSHERLRELLVLAYNLV